MSIFGKLGKSGWSPNLHMVANGIGMMGGAPSNSALLQLGAQAQQMRAQRAKQQQFAQMLKDPKYSSMLPKSVMGMAQFMDPSTVAQLAMRHKLQQQKLAQGPASAQYGKQGYAYRDQDGNHYLVQMGSDGTLKKHKLDIAKDRGVTTVDTGTGTRVIDRTSGRDVRSIDKDIAGAEQQKIVGKNEGNKIVNKPKAITALNTLKTKNRVMLSTIDQALKSLDWSSTGLMGWATAGVPGTPAYKLKNYLTTIKANIGFDALQAMREASPTGGALGQVAVQELVALQATLGSLDQAQSPAEIKRVLEQVREIGMARSQRHREAYQQTYGALPAGYTHSRVRDHRAGQQAPATNADFSIRRID